MGLSITLGYSSTGPSDRVIRFPGVSAGFVPVAGDLGGTGGGGPLEGLGAGGGAPAGGIERCLR